MCGIVGIVSNIRKNVAVYVYDALNIIQHRGQDAAGIVTAKNDRLLVHKANGLVRNVFHTRHITELIGSMGIGHVRYPTAGSSSAAEAQPFYVNSPYGIAFAHNGNLTNARELAKDLFREDLRHINTHSDSEILLNVFASELSKIGKTRIDEKQIFKAIVNLNNRVKGAYASIGIIPNFGIFAFRDPNGIRPLILGKKIRNSKVEYILASESSALTALNYKIIKDIGAGEAVVIKENGAIYFKLCAQNIKHNPCIFEFVYFARPDSIIDNISVYKSRLRMGEILAKRIKEQWQDEKIDVVIPIPDTSRNCALELANTLGVKYREGFIKNRYIARTFIMPGQKIRKKSVKQKLSAISLEFKGKNVLLVDDSIVRGTTSKQIVQMARDAGSKKIFFASAAPTVRYPNVYGIDMASDKEFIAFNRNVQEICAEIGADKLIYQRLDDLVKCAQAGNLNIKDFDCSCFNGKYVTGDVTAEYLYTIENIRHNVKDKHNSTLNII